MSRIFKATHEPTEITARVLEKAGYVDCSDGRVLWGEVGQVEVLEGVNHKEYLIDGRTFLISYKMPDDIKALIKSLNSLGG